MLLAAALALSMAGQDGQMPALPASFRRDALRACAPTTVEDAEACLRASVNAEDFAILADRIPSRRFRGFIDCEIELAWRLGDSTSPMGRLMEGLLGFHHPRFAAGMIISDLQARSHGGGLPFDTMRERFRTEPPPLGPAPATACNASTTPSA